MATFPSKVNYATGDILTATNMNDIGGAINLLDGAQYSAGKNKIINGDFSINQRAFTSTTTSAAYGFDRWNVNMVDGTVTYSAQTFTPGAAPVAGYEAANYARVITTGQTLTTARANFSNPIEDVRTLAGQTATLSFWAKAATGTPKIAIELNQNFGSGGSPSTGVTTYAGQVTLSTSWARYSVTVAVPSISGKTLGTTANTSILQCNLFVSAGSTLNSRTGSLGIQSNTFDIWGVQVEEADTASPFQTASGSIQGELALAQRYYWRAGGQSSYQNFGIGLATSATNVRILLTCPVQMRTSPSSIDFSTLAAYDAAVQNSVTAVAFSQQGTLVTAVDCTTTGLTTSRATTLIANNSTSAYIGLNAEL